jgi:hypothetical protein
MMSVIIPVVVSGRLPGENENLTFVMDQSVQESQPSNTGSAFISDSSTQSIRIKYHEPVNSTISNIISIGDTKLYMEEIQETSQNHHLYLPDESINESHKEMEQIISIDTPTTSRISSTAPVTNKTLQLENMIEILKKQLILKGKVINISFNFNDKECSYDI